MNTIISSGSLWQRVVQDAAAESIQSDPLKNFTRKPSSTDLKKPSKSKSSSKSSSAAPGADEGQEVVGKGGKIERRMFLWDQVFNKTTGQEYSFEEIRAGTIGLGVGSTSGWGAKEVRDWEKEWHTPTSELESSTSFFSRHVSPLTLHPI